MFHNTIIKKMDGNSLRVYINHLKQKFHFFRYSKYSLFSNKVNSIYKKI